MRETSVPNAIVFFAGDARQAGHASLARVYARRYADMAIGNRSSPAMRHADTPRAPVVYRRTGPSSYVHGTFLPAYLANRDVRLRPHRALLPTMTPRIGTAVRFCFRLEFMLEFSRCVRILPGSFLLLPQ